MAWCQLCTTPATDRFLVDDTDLDFRLLTLTSSANGFRGVKQSINNLGARAGIDKFRQKGKSQSQQETAFS